MCIVAVSEEPFSGGQEFARSLAKGLGLPYVDAVVLFERAAAWGGDATKLRAAVQTTPTFRDRFTRDRQNQLLLLQAALAEEIQNGNAVCYGIAADLLNLETPQILRIGLHASHRFRRLQVQEHLGFRGAQADRYLNEQDRARRRWLLYLFGATAVLPMACDLVMNLEELGLHDAGMRVSELIRDQNRFDAADPAPIQSFAASTRIKAALAQDPDTAHLDVDVEIQGDTASLRGTVRSIEELDSVKQARFALPAGLKVDFTQVQLGNWDYVPPLFPLASVKSHLKATPESQSSVLLRPAWLLTGISGMLLLAVAGSWVRGHWFHPADTRLLTFAGVITDSQCGLSHKGVHPTVECVRTCVKESGAKYVLNDGTHSFVITDQQTGERFAAQRVVASGYLDEITGNLQLRSVAAAAQ